MESCLSNLSERKFKRKDNPSTPGSNKQNTPLFKRATVMAKTMQAFRLASPD